MTTKTCCQAAKGIAQGNILFRGESVVVNEVKPLLPRKPYDAPNWVRTDRPVTFGELKTYEEQLQSSGLEPAAINVSLNLPPDLYLMRSTGIDMDINYRYTMPPVKDSSRMDISLNNQFLQSFNLSSKQEANRLAAADSGITRFAGWQNGCLYSSAETGRDQPAAVRL